MTEAIHAANATDMHVSLHTPLRRAREPAVVELVQLNRARAGTARSKMRRMPDDVPHRSATAPASTARFGPHDLKGYAWAILSVAVATIVGWPLRHRLDLDNANVLMLYLLAVLWIATHYSRGPAVLA